MITVLTNIADRPNPDNALERLARPDENYAKWWRAYSTAMNATQLDQRTSRLRWCIESAHLLSEDAGFYRKMCKGKLAFLENRVVPVDDADTNIFQSSVTVHEVMVNGPTEAAAE